MMKRILPYAAAALLLHSCAEAPIKITVGNSLDFDRQNEMVEIDASLIPADFKNKTYILRNAQGQECPWQLSDNESLFIFQASVPAGKSVTYELRQGLPRPVTPRTDARFVPQRKDDLSWENDMAAYRMYGPALAPENPSNGVDLWLKCTDSLVTAKLYADELERGISYHENHSGLGLDCYDVKHTAGAGGIAPYTSRLWTGNHFNRHAIHQNGPLRSIFTLSYDNAPVDSLAYRQEITITATAGSLLNKAAVSYHGPAADMKLAAGIYLHDGSGNMYADPASSLIGYAEQALSGLKKEPQGKNYAGVYLPGSSGIITQDNHLLILKDYRPGDTITYYFGGGWSKWKYPTEQEWFAALAQFSAALRQPFNIQITKQD
ncbi:MAG: DUF4861 domain-containing protein [Tannerellaceae bacterium]|jgi:hypothetical protein|nr:DUF4861 domain-containing protein [Tannerellaceae bacterium]